MIPPIIGLDLDNTIACYDDAIKYLADAHLGIPPNVAKTKMGVRDYLRGQGKEEAWVDFQGLLYGPGMEYARPYDGSIEVMQKLESLGCRLFIISHRSRYPYGKIKYDLHEFAYRWINSNILSEGLMSNNILSVHGTGPISFHVEKEGKLEKIKEVHCDLFLDDLPGILNHSLFPPQTKGVLFDPLKTDGNAIQNEGIVLQSVKSWSEFFCYCNTIMLNG